MSIQSESPGSPGLRKRFLFISLAAMAIFLLIVLRLWYLQIINVERYQHLSEKNRIRYIPVAAARGPIFDRHGALLVDNRPAFGISVLRQEIEDRDRLLERLAGYLGVEQNDLLQKWEGGSRFPRYRPLPLAEDVSRDALERVQENSIDLPGVLAEVRPLRSYPNEEMAAHLFGYLGEITEEKLREDKEDFYRSGDFIGKSGLEKHLETTLRGIAGEKRVEVDVSGNDLRLLKTQDPIPGKRVYLTLDREVQLAAEEALGDQAGAAVALDVRTGEVIAIASRPAFNPAEFARGISGENWIKLLKDSRHPLQNKAIKGQYPPASTFKIITALAALKAKVVTPSTTVYCNGKFTLGSRDFRCWKRTGHGSTDLKKALRESCDVYFYQVGLDVGIDRLAQTAMDFGLGAPLGFALEGERGGLVPTRQWKQARFNDRWYDGETVIASIGQGYVLATPLQLAVMTAAVANGGTVYRPQVVMRIEDLEGKVLEKSTPDALRTIPLDPASVQAIQNSLVSVVQDPHGTGRSSQVDGITVAGKTGTAQVVKLRDDRHKDESKIPYRFRDHALFVAYAPAEDPQIAVAVVVEHGMSGGAAGGPIAKAILEAYFHRTPEMVTAEMTAGDEETPLSASPGR